MTWNPKRWSVIYDSTALRSNCFVVAGVASRRFGWRYCEGVANLTAGHPPQHHAWCLDADDRVIELVWPHPGYGYYGTVVEPTEIGTAVFDPGEFISVPSR
jgi:hypothetical protein